jgi:2-polyprenyl-3-methyl-5-hydroxy-6-metoxy-1,4-benzoquinol methylase
VDCIVMTEEHAGWANIVAEAMASGVPAICTPHGTLSIARHEETALVIDTPSPEAIADAILRLRGDWDLCASLSAKARQTIEPLNWELYTEKLLDICEDREKKDYYQAPEYGLYGKWPVSQRLRDLDPVLEDCAGRTVLDLGAAEGIVARQFLTRSAKLVHGFEMDPRRVDTARQICAQWEGTAFRDADVSHWDRFVEENGDLLLQSYDIVLYLGLHQHLARLRRAKVIRSAARLATRYFVLRMPVAVFELDGLAEVLKSEGLEEVAMSDAPNAASMGPVRIYRRAQA